MILKIGRFELATFLVLAFTNQFLYANSLIQIPDSIQKGSDAICLKHDIKIEVIGNKALITSYTSTKILNANGKSNGDLTLFYQTNTPVNYIKGNVYDSNGKKVQSLKGKDIKDVSMTSDYSLFDDYRAKTVEIFYPSYPYTVEYEYQQTLNGFISLPSWIPVNDYRVGVLNASITLTFQENNPINYKYFNLQSPAINKVTNGDTQLKWEISNIKPIQQEPFSSRIYEVSPFIMFTPSCFNFHNSEGCFTSWESYGTWVFGLLKGRNTISETLKNQLISLTSSARNVREKVKIVYKFMQSQTRYVSIQLGIGGFQPFPASDVEMLGYGDCKALSNYTMTLLEAVGIKSYYTEIGISRMNIKHKDFPSASQTDHVILNVPLENDTIWLECTNQRYPFGYLSHRHQGQNVMVVTEKGGDLKKIPSLGIAGNTQLRKGKFNIDSVGNAKGELTTICHGGEIENLMPEIWVSKKEQLEILNRKYRIPNLTILDFNFLSEDDSTLYASETINFTINNVASRTGKRLFLKLNSFGLVPTPPVKNKERFSDLVIDQSFSHVDSITYSLPDGFRVESVPDNVNNTSSFGNISVSYIIDKNMLICVKKFSLIKNQFPANEYNNFVDFMSSASKLDNQSIVLTEN